ncbi:hypothetical protein KJ780_03860 [Candidatus Micrarchaeota archaeon]|nr:hypothetical protein [Candidatus Micrarchaeota archaeon]
MDPELEKAFQNVCEIILGKKMGKIKDYEAWLKSYVPDQLVTKSPLSGRTIYSPAFEFWRRVGNNIIGEAESLELGKQGIPKESVVRLNLKNAGELLKPISKLSSEAIVGSNISVEKCGAYGYSMHCYDGTYFVQSKYSACCFWPRQSEYAFGCAHLFSSKFCINCYYSLNLTRCFEMLDCNTCSDSYFCHNSENLDNCIFCFNAKNLKYAICNLELGREQYMRIKKILLDEITKKLEINKKIDLSIYNVGCRGK